MNNFERGFITKCAEYGVDPDILIKEASKGFRKALALAKRIKADGKPLPENLKQIIDEKYIKTEPYKKVIEKLDTMNRYASGVRERFPNKKIKNWDDFLDAYYTAHPRDETAVPVIPKWNKQVESAFKAKQYTADEFRKLYPNKGYTFRVTNGGGIYDENDMYWVSGLFQGAEDFAKKYGKDGGLLLEVRPRPKLPEYREFGNKIFHPHSASANWEENLKKRLETEKYGGPFRYVKDNPNYEAIINGRTMQNRDIVQYFRLYPTKGGKLMVRTDSGRLADNIPSIGLSSIVPSINKPNSYKQYRDLLKEKKEINKEIVGRIKKINFNKLEDTNWYWADVGLSRRLRDLHDLHNYI